MIGIVAPSWSQTPDPGLPGQIPGQMPGQMPGTTAPGDTLPDRLPVPRENSTPQTDAERLDSLFAELAEPGRADWQSIENDIAHIWAKSGSPAMDLLLARGAEANAAQDYPLALDHYSALIDHAPDFAEGWNARATTYFLMGEYSLSMSDIEHVLALNPRHFGALQGVAVMLEELGDPKRALDAWKAVQHLNPNNPKTNDTVKRLERVTGAAEL